MADAEAISFVIGHFRDYFAVWFLTRTDGIASPALGGLAMTISINNPIGSKRIFYYFFK